MNNLQEHDRESSILKDFFRFLRNPQPVSGKSEFQLQAVLKSLYLYVVIFVLGILIVTPLFSLIHIEEIPHQIETFIDQFPRWQAFLIVVIMAPFLEEFIFRFPIKYPAMSYVFISILIIGSFYYALDRLTEFPWIIHTTIAFAVIIILFLSRGLVYRKNQLYSWFQKYYFIVFYLFAVIFAVVHIFNFEGDFVKWYFIPVLVFPQLTLALVLGYLRLRFGMWSNIFIHGFNNLWPMLMLFASDSISIPGM